MRLSRQDVVETAGNKSFLFFHFSAVSSSYAQNLTLATPLVVMPTEVQCEEHYLRLPERFFFSCSTQMSSEVNTHVFRRKKEERE